MKVYFGLSVLVIMFFVSPASWGASTTLSLPLNLDNEGRALAGYDPVSYHTGKPLQGNTELSFEHDGAIYLFSSRANRELFAADPGTYLPAFGGWCAWAMLDGEKVEVDPETYKIVKGTLYLYYNSFFVNTLSRWNTRAKNDTEEKLIEKAQSEWILLLQKQ